MRFGFLGAGNMAGALMTSVVQTGTFAASEVCFYDPNAARASQLCADLHVQAMESAEATVCAADILLVGVKPNMVEKVLSGVREQLKNKAIISIAAGWSTERLHALLDDSTRLLRVMPNTPALVGEGMTALCKAHTLLPHEVEIAEKMFSAAGRIAWLDEYLMEAETGVAGSGPAYAFLFIEAMADGGVLKGLPRAMAMEMAAQTLLGAAKMVLESGKHPGELKDMVCSPAGTTIEAVRALEAGGFRASVIDAVCAAADKATQMRG